MQLADSLPGRSCFESRPVHTVPLSRSGDAAGRSWKVEYELERLLEGALLIDGQVADSSAESAGVNGGDHLAEDLRCVAVQRDLRVEAGRKR